MTNISDRLNLKEMVLSVIIFITCSGVFLLLSLVHLWDASTAILLGNHPYAIASCMVGSVFLGMYFYSVIRCLSLAKKIDEVIKKKWIEMNSKRSGGG